MLLEKTLESPLDCEEIQPVHPKLVLNIHWKNWCWSWSFNSLATHGKKLIEKDPDDGKDWRLEEKGATEDEMVRWHHQLSGHELSKLLEIEKGRDLWHAGVCGVTEWDTTESLNDNLKEAFGTCPNCLQNNPNTHVLPNQGQGSNPYSLLRHISRSRRASWFYNKALGTKTF